MEFFVCFWCEYEREREKFEEFQMRWSFVLKGEVYIVRGEKIGKCCKEIDVEF